MLYVFAGDDGARISHESRLAVDKEIARGAHVREVRGTQTTRAYEDFASGVTLFGGSQVFLMDEVLESAEGKETFCEATAVLAASPHLFVVRTGKLDKETEAVIKTTNAKLWDLSVSDKPKHGGFNIFSLADAFGERDKKRTWTLFAQAVEHGIAAEEIHGTLFWISKNMLAVKRVSDPATTGLSPFVLSKAVRFSRNFSQSELEEIVHRMVTIYHDAHRGGAELDLELERMVLDVLSKKSPVE
ncbi:MAG: hypothetical protein ACYC8S_03740 [Minisyncoccota bacterium]